VLRLALCDDDAAFRRLLHVLLSAEHDMQVVGESCDGRACIEQVARARPDAVLLDLSMPGMSGLAAIPELAEASPRTKIIVLSGEDPARVAPVVRDLGAAAFIAKEQGDLIDSLPPRIRSVMGAGPTPRAA
jgi:DNA-binding NarL/FixJ family response regulator